MRNDTKKIRIFSDNLGLQTTVKDYKSIEYNGKLDLIKAGIKSLGIKEGLDIHIKTEAPPGSGMGTSASVAVALLSALARIKGITISPKEIASLAHQLEVRELHLESGVQDQFAAALGGLNYMEIDYPSVNIERIKINKGRIFELERQLIVIFIGQRSSSEMHQAVIKNYKNQDPDTLRSLEIMCACATNMKRAINSNMEDIGAIMNENWAAQKQLHPLMTNPLIEKAETIAFKNKALGFKVNGAGGGGSITVLSSLENEHELRKTFLKSAFSLIPCKLSFAGVHSTEI